MTHRLIIILLFLTFGFFSNASIHFDKTGTISGKVVDAETGEGLSFANVIIEGTTIGVTTNLEGKYELKVEPGNYNVVASYIGYVELVKPTTVTSKEVTELNFELTYGNLLKEVTVSAQASGQIAAINEQLASNKIVNVVSAEKMEELPDANVAESIGRLPGISLQR